MRGRMGGMSDAIFEIDCHKIRVLDGPYLASGTPTPKAHEFARQLLGMLDQMRAFAAKEHLATYNEAWREDDQPALTADDFASRLTDPSIVLYDEIGAASIYFQDSEMFLGHSIEVSLNDGNITHASIVG
jgi:hypothetical protein